ncbi:MAG TPA: hypothetical protein PK864_01210 [Syntrophorhabdaceae bacterium]|nr:hypothetical protein [Syntrophorhabdaceae bacterium]HOT42170.1 hypothetical protein [Syntrophorhabdaceae bacterium]HPC67332.1 hypothetical protein [Syntrophorhabdaceae bacterium]HQH42871.1 hypothetical protein [Syntrophorhabdaceae bacterium]HQK46507.1 hypothetical protein [Syntrophorhabdaceae bacterium]
MEAQEITNRYCSLFDEVVPILTTIYKGFVSQKINLLKESRAKLREVWKSRLPAVEEIIGDKEKNEAEKRFVAALPHLQRVALAIDNLIDRMETKIEADVLFSPKAIDEIKQLMLAVGAEFTDVKSYCMTRSQEDKDKIKADFEKVWKMISEFEITHQNRLIIGVCMPKASYLYIDITDSLKRIAKELAEFADFA